LLLGYDAAWSELRSHESITGWVSEDKCSVWSSREAVYFNRDNFGQRPSVEIFESAEDALRSANGERPEHSPIAREMPNIAASLTYDRSRFPVIEQRRVGGVRILKILYIGYGQSLFVEEGWAALEIQGVRMTEELQ